MSTIKVTYMDGKEEIYTGVDAMGVDVLYHDTFVRITVDNNREYIVPFVNVRKLEKND